MRKELLSAKEARALVEETSIAMDAIILKEIQKNITTYAMGRQRSLCIPAFRKGLIPILKEAGYVVTFFPLSGQAIVSW
jgi:hypothetical protein